MFYNFLLACSIIYAAWFITAMIYMQALYRKAMTKYKEYMEAYSKERAKELRQRVYLRRSNLTPPTKPILEINPWGFAGFLLCIAFWMAAIVS